MNVYYECIVTDDSKKISKLVENQHLPYSSKFHKPCSWNKKTPQNHNLYQLLEHDSILIATKLTTDPRS